MRSQWDQPCEEVSRHLKGVLWWMESEQGEGVGPCGRCSHIPVMRCTIATSGKTGFMPSPIVIARLCNKFAWASLFQIAQHPCPSDSLFWVGSGQSIRFWLYVGCNLIARRLRVTFIGLPASWHPQSQLISAVSYCRRLSSPTFCLMVTPLPPRCDLFSLSPGHLSVVPPQPADC